MKILQIIPSLHGGGAEKFVIDLSNELVKTNEVILCSLFPIEKYMFLTDLIDKKIKIVTLNKKLGLDLKIFREINVLIKKEKPDVVNTHLRALFYSSYSVMMSKIKFFHTIHNMAVEETTKQNRFIYKIFFKYFNVTPVSISKRVLDSVHHEYSSDYNVLIENGVKKVGVSFNISKVKEEIQSFKMTENTKVLVHIGRIAEQKNQVLLINAFNELVENGYDIILLIIGEDGTENQIILQQLQSISGKGIYFLGMRKNVVDYLVNSDAFCLSSLYEGLPITLLEALSVGTVPVCTPAGGIVDILREDIGFLSRDFSINEYYDALKSFLESTQDKIEKIAQNDKDLFDRKYDIAITSQNYLSLYTECQ